MSDEYEDLLWDQGRMRHEFDPAKLTFLCDEELEQLEGCPDFQTIQAVYEDEVIGLLEMDACEEGGEISNVFVVSHLRRLGIASALLAEAHRLHREGGLLSPVHSHLRTADGDAWARAVGGAVMTLVLQEAYVS